MNNELISKKNLLELTGISYGQLYRWKRKKLIPEEWFIKKSSYTGQETFFPKEEILQRIDKIKNLKDENSLDDIAEVFSPNLNLLEISRTELIKRNIVSEVTLTLFDEILGFNPTLDFDRIVLVYFLEKVLMSGDLNREECKILIDTISTNPEFMQNAGNWIYIIRKYGVSICFLASNSSLLVFDKDTKIIIRINENQLQEEIKLLFNTLENE